MSKKLKSIPLVMAWPNTRVENNIFSQKQKCIQNKVHW